MHKHLDQNMKKNKIKYVEYNFMHDAW